MKTRFVSSIVAFMSTAFLFAAIEFMIENRYSNMENQLSNSVRIIAEENVRTVFYGYFC